MLWALACAFLLLIILSIENNNELKNRGRRSEEISGVGFFLYDEGECDCEGSEGGEGIDGM